MTRRFISLLLAVLVPAVAVLTAPSFAQKTDQNQRAPHPEEALDLLEFGLSGGEPFLEMAPQWGREWEDGAPSPFKFTRFDGAYSLKHNKVFFLGGRKADGTTDGSVWSMNLSFVYSDTGVDLVVPVSNYTANLLEDSSGFSFYIFCGRNNAGTLVNNVQIYHPDTNTAELLGPEDNYPGSGTCTAGLNVVYKNKVYLAGGFDPINSPYNWGETWVFDPMAPAGFRWSPIATANLSRPRAYIMSAVVDHKIYAIGGSLRSLPDCSYELCTVKTVEVLDLSRPTLTWNDDSAADLPEACSEGRAFGFDSTNQYRDFDGTSLAGQIVVTCGGWPNESERVYVYNTLRDSWDTFPSLNRTRRNQAAEFIPASYIGLGLMGVWGGRSGTDSNVLDIPEGYYLATSSCSVLLVDDDWDFDETAPNDGGRPYYSSVLNYLGFPYKVWDTATQGTPSSAELSKHNIVVWFTGYDYETPISPAEQTALIAYLNGGGKLVMSSMEQEHAYPNSIIMSNYFRVDSVTTDVKLKTVKGNPADTLYANLGSYNLVRPDDVTAYWPTGVNEGPLDDAVTAKPGAYEPMLYGSGLGSSTRYDGGVFKTLYLAFPLEWVNSIQERAQILGPALSWMCPKSIYLPFVRRGQ